MTDLTYLTTGLFTTFFVESESGAVAYKELLEQNEKSNKIFTHNLKPVLSQLRSAGYKVSKAKKSNITMEQILNELNDMEGK